MWLPHGLGFVSGATVIGLLNREPSLVGMFCEALAHKCDVCGVVHGRIVDDPEGEASELPGQIPERVPFHLTTPLGSMKDIWGVAIRTIVEHKYGVHWRVDCLPDKTDQGSTTEN